MPYCPPSLTASSTKLTAALSTDDRCNVEEIAGRFQPMPCPSTPSTHLMIVLQLCVNQMATQGGTREVPSGRQMETRREVGLPNGSGSFHVKSEQRGGTWHPFLWMWTNIPWMKTSLRTEPKKIGCYMETRAEKPYGRTPVSHNTPVLT